MSLSLTVNNREYIPAGEVGKHFGYTRDYILTLARDGKIDGQKIGHRWYVNLESAKTYFEVAKNEREARRQEISAERKAELRTYAVAKKSSKRSVATLEVVGILVVGLLVGFTGYVGVVKVPQQAALFDSDSSFVRNLARSLYELISPKPTVIETTTVTEQTVVNTPTDTLNAPIEEPINAVVGTTTHTSLVIGSDEIMTTTTIDSIRKSFSDEVSVSMDPHNPDSGIIVPHFKDGDGESYRYLIVPVTEESGS